MRSLIYLCTEAGMIPAAKDLVAYHKSFEAGRHYRLEEAKERSRESHNDYFQMVFHAWGNLPESERDLFATDDHWRQFCLIKAGFRNEIVQTYDSRNDAIQASAGVALLARRFGQFIITTITGNMLTIYTARTQKMKKTSDDGMDKADFEASKQAVLEICCARLHCTEDELRQNARKAA